MCRLDAATSGANNPRSREVSMRIQVKLAATFVAAMAALSSPPVQAQSVGKYLAPKDQVVAIRAGRLFDSRSGTMSVNQIVLIRGDRITDVGGGVQIPSGARIVDLSAAT